MAISALSSNLLGSIISRSRQFTQKLEARGIFSACKNTTPTPYIPEPLPEADPRVLETRLRELGLQNPYIRRICATFSKNAGDLRHRTESKLRSAATAQRSDIQGLRSAYSAFYKRQLESWEETIVASASSFVPATPADSPEPKKLISPYEKSKPKSPPFNVRYVPFLEHCFDENAYPNVGDIHAYAELCGMTPRQITVWFQNRRRRLKAKGVLLIRKPWRQGPKVATDGVEIRMASFIIPPDQRKERRDQDELESEYEDGSLSGNEDNLSVLRRPTPPQEIDILDPDSAPHAFPMKWTSQTDPLHAEPNNFSFPPPIWKRARATKPTQRGPADFEELTALFSELKVGDEEPSELRQKKATEVPEASQHPSRATPPTPKPDPSAATMFITVRPPKARHPAFIPTDLHSIEPPIRISPSQIPPTRPSQAQMQAYPSPSPLLTFMTATIAVPPASSTSSPLTPLTPAPSTPAPSIPAPLISAPVMPALSMPAPPISMPSLSTSAPPTSMPSLPTTASSMPTPPMLMPVMPAPLVPAPELSIDDILASLSSYSNPATSAVDFADFNASYASDLLSLSFTHPSSFVSTSSPPPLISSTESSSSSVSESPIRTPPDPVHYLPEISSAQDFFFHDRSHSLPEFLTDIPSTQSFDLLSHSGSDFQAALFGDTFCFGNPSPQSLDILPSPDDVPLDFPLGVGGFGVDNPPAFDFDSSDFDFQLYDQSLLG